MTNPSMTMWRRISAALITTAAMTTLASGGVDQPSAQKSTSETSKEKEAAALDRLVMANGTVVTGTIVEETATEVKIIVTVRGITTGKPTTYKKSEIIEITRGVKPEGESATATPTTSKPAVKDKETKKKDPIKERLAETGDDTGAQLYIAKLSGLFGRDISETPMRRLFEDIDKTFNDIEEISTPAGTRTQVKEEFRNQHIVVLKLDAGTNPQQGFDGLWRAEDIGPIIEEQIVERKRRVVFWVERAENGAALFPWVSREMYFEPEARMGFSGDLETFNIGDQMVNEKQISLRIGHAEGFAVKGGYDPTLVKPMVRSRYWLYVRFEGGKPIYNTQELKPEEVEAGGWVLLSDDGKNANKDKEDALRGNDLLTLDADWAQKLGISKGTCETNEDLAFALGVNRNYKVVSGDGEKILKKWREEVQSVIDQISRNPQSPGRLWREFSEIQVRGNLNDRQEARGKQLRILKQVVSLLTRYKEWADPEGQQAAQYNVQIEQIKQQQSLDSRANR